MGSNHQEHLDILDGLRGLMALWVFLYHVMNACTGMTTPWGAGGMAVDVFMILSGFLMTYHWQIRMQEFNKFRYQIIDFYIRRFFRIAPLYYLLLLIALLGHTFFLFTRNYVESTIHSPSTGLYYMSLTNIHLSWINIFTHYTFIFGLIPIYAHNIILPDWSISLEMQFYILFPFIMAAISRLGGFLNVVVAIIISHLTFKLINIGLSPNMLTGWMYPQPSLLLFKINVFMSGICFGMAYLSKKESALISWIILGFLSLYNTALQVKIIAFFMIFMLIFDYGKIEILHKLAISKLAKFLGDTSYAVYLLHMIFVFPVLYFLFHLNWFLSLTIHTRLLIAIFIIGLPVYSLAYVLFKLIELPGIGMGKILGKKWNNFK